MAATLSLIWIGSSSACEDAIVASVYISGGKDDSNALLAWREALRDLPVTKHPNPELATLPRLMEWMEIASGGKRVLMRRYSLGGTCNATTCTGCLGSLTTNESDISLHYHHVSAADAAHVDHLWRVGHNDIMLATLKKNVQLEEDVFLLQIRLLMGSCLLALLVAVVLSVTVGLARRSCVLSRVAAWYVELLSQQGSYELWTDAKLASKLVMFGGMVAFVLCLNLITARLASDIALRKLDETSLKTLNDLGFKAILGAGQAEALTTKVNPVVRQLLNNENFVEIMRRQEGEMDRYTVKTVRKALETLLRGDREDVFMVARAAYVAAYVPLQHREKFSLTVLHQETKSLNRLVMEKNNC